MTLGNLIKLFVEDKILKGALVSSMCDVSAAAGQFVWRLTKKKYTILYIHV